MLRLVSAPMKRALAWSVGILALFGAIYAKGRQSGTAAAKVKRIENELDAHRRIDDADIGVGAADRDNVEWLRKFHDKHRR